MCFNDLCVQFLSLAICIKITFIICKDRYFICGVYVPTTRKVTTWINYIYSCAYHVYVDNCDKSDQYKGPKWLGTKAT